MAGRGRRTGGMAWEAAESMGWRGAGCALSKRRTTAAPAPREGARAAIATKRGYAALVLEEVTRRQTKAERFRVPAAAAAEPPTAPRMAHPGGKIVKNNAARAQQRYLERKWSKLSEEPRRGLQQRIAASAAAEAAKAAEARVQAETPTAAGRRRRQRRNACAKPASRWAS